MFRSICMDYPRFNMLKYKNEFICVSAFISTFILMYLGMDNFNVLLFALSIGCALVSCVYSQKILED